MTSDVPIHTKKNQSNAFYQSKYILVKCDHQKHKENQYSRANGLADYKPIFTVLHQTNDLHDIVVKLNEAVATVENHDLMIEKLIINDKVIEVYDKTRGYFKNSNKLLFTYSIIEC